MTKKDILEILQNYNYYNARLADIQEQIESMCFKVTATYGNLAPSVSGYPTNKVEKYGDKVYMLSKKEETIKRKIDIITKLIENSGLDEQEKGVIWWVAKNGKLQAYARRERIGKDNVYKIRDRALNKIIAANKTRNVV